MSKTAEFIKLLSVLVLCLLVLGMLWFFIPKIAELSVAQPEQNPQISVYDQSSSAGFGEKLSQKIKETLEKVSGKGTVSASVIADVIQGEENIQKNTILPHSGVIKEMVHQTDTAGVGQRDEEKAVYDYSFETKSQTHNMQRIRKLAVTVLIDGYVTQTATGGTLYQPRSNIEMTSYRVLVESLIGYTPERGDTLELINLPFVKQPDNLLFGFDRALVVQSVLLALFFLLCMLILVRFILPMIYVLLQPVPVQQHYVPSSNPIDGTIPAGKSDVIKNVFKYKLSSAVSVVRGWIYAQTDGALNGVQKAAVLLLALGEEYIKPVFLRLRDEEVTKVSRTMAELGCVKGAVVQTVFDDFLTALNGMGDICSDKEYIHDLMESVLPEKNKQVVMDDIELPVHGKNIWEKLEQTDAAKLAEALGEEYPQTIAVVLYHLSNEKAGAILNHFSESLTMDVLMRLTALKEVDAETLSGVEKGLESRLKSLYAGKSPKGGKEKAAGIISLMDRKADILNTLFERSPELADQLSAGVIMFENIADWDDKSIRTLLEKADRSVVVCALKGASDKMKEAFSRNMSPAVWGGILKETNKLSAIKVKEIDAAQNVLVRMAQELIEQRKIVIGK